MCRSGIIREEADMGYLTRIYRLLNQGYRELQEDFLTEVFAEVLQDSSLLRSFCAHFLKRVPGQLEQVKVSTQVTLMVLIGMEFKVEPNSNPPTNMHVIVNRARSGHLPSRIHQFSHCRCTSFPLVQGNGKVLKFDTSNSRSNCLQSDKAEKADRQLEC